LERRRAGLALLRPPPMTDELAQGGHSRTPNAVEMFRRAWARNRSESGFRAVCGHGISERCCYAVFRAGRANYASGFEAVKPDARAGSPFGGSRPVSGCYVRLLSGGDGSLVGRLGESRLGLLLRLEPDPAIDRQTGARGDQVADDHVLLEAAELVHLPVDR